MAGLVINGFTDGAGVGAGWEIDNTPSTNQIRDNYIGTDASGSQAVPNGSGVSIHGWGSPGMQATANVVEHNLISGNTGDGLNFCDAAGTQVRQNLIGVDRTGTQPLGNGRMGVNLGCAGAPNNLFEDNIIAYNAGDGIFDQPDYRYWGSLTADGHQRNRFRRNAIYANGGLGINLTPRPFGTIDGPTPNDPGDADEGANKLQNYPVLGSACTLGGTTTVSGTLNSTANAAFEIDLYANQAVDPSGFGEGQRFLMTLSVQTDASGNAGFSVTLPAPLPTGEQVTATATDADGNTSEFSAPVGTCDALTPLDRAQAYLADVMDQYHRTLDVYTDAGSPGNHFVYRAMMGSGVTNDDSFTGDVHSGATAVRGTFTAAGSNWGGFYFMNGVLSGQDRQPSENWGTSQCRRGRDWSHETYLLGARCAGWRARRVLRLQCRAKRRGAVRPAIP